jgi:hypothetical protein
MIKQTEFFLVGMGVSGQKIEASGEVFPQIKIVLSLFAN